MATIVTAPDEMTELHNAALTTPLGAVNELRRIAFRARGLAAKRPNDVGVALTAAIALMVSGLHNDALPFAKRAFDMRFGAAAMHGEIVAACVDLGLFNEARLATEEICAKRSYAPDNITISNCSHAAFLAGDVALLRRVRDFAPENLTAIPGTLLDIIDRNGMEPYLSGHMGIVNRYVTDACCSVNIEIGCFSDDGDELTIAVDYHLALSMEECLARSTAVGRELRAFYRATGREDLPYLNAIIEDFRPMPAFMDV
jgi:hypothetical protein